MIFSKSLIIALVTSSIFIGTNNQSQTINRHEDLFAENNFRNDGLYYLTPDFQNKESFEQSSVLNPLIGDGSGGNTNGEDVFVRNDNFRSAYFKNLNSNMPRNKLGICGYTGISMLLSYFDTYWSDLFIDEKYESEPSEVNSNEISSTTPDYSPGVFNNITSSGPTMQTFRNTLVALGLIEGTDRYKEELDKLIMQQVMDQINQKTFLGKLFSIALGNGSIKPHYDSSDYQNHGYIHVNNDGYLSNLGVNYDPVSAILYDYVQQQPSLVGNVSIITSKMTDESETEKNRIREEIIELVQSGKPVLMGGNGYNDTNFNGVKDESIPEESEWGHVIVAYEYNETTDTLYGNWGWSGAWEHGNIDEKFNIRIHDYWCFNIGEELPQTATNNYKISNSNLYVSPSGQVFELSTYQPDSFNYEAQYFFEAKSLNVQNGDYVVSTNRLRTGYIENSFINLSPHRAGAGHAFLEIYSPTYINRFAFDASFWSENEYADKLNFSALVQYKTPTSDWITLLDLVKDINLSENRWNQDHFGFIFSECNVNAIRIDYTDLIPFGSRNKGRISIGELSILHL